MFKIEQDPVSMNYTIKAYSGDYLNDIFKAIIRASYSMERTNCGKFINDKEKDILTDKEINEYISHYNMQDRMSIFMKDCKGKECYTFLEKVGTPYLFRFRNHTLDYKRGKGASEYLLSLAKQLAQENKENDTDDFKDFLN